MNPVLQKKLQELEEARDYECWYLVKQPTAFDSLCYLVSFLKEFQTGDVSGNLRDFVGEKIKWLGETKPQMEISNNYRALRAAAFFGLITVNSGGYEKAVVTETFEEINQRCGGAFEKKELYTDIIERQIEKMFISSKVDEEYNGVREHYRLYPVMLLYKILLELGRAGGEYVVTMTEYRYLIATTKVYTDFLDTLLLIKLLREDPSVNPEFETYRTKFDSRMIQALKQLPALDVGRESISIRAGYVEEVAEKVFQFESGEHLPETEEYLAFLGSSRSLEEVLGKKNANDSGKPDFRTGYRSEFARNRIVFGAPGTGKSYTLDAEKERLLASGGAYERVTFHPNYSYANFVGTYKPVSGKDEDGKDVIRYEYVPGPFMRVYADALENSMCKDNIRPYLLLIEEMNRANVAAVFGEVFQLLDRDGNHVSEYSIHAAEDMKKYLADRLHCSREEVSEIRIPDNMFIWATMNSADQGVFPMDTAFKRRWDFEYIGVDDGAAAAEQYIIPVGMGAQRKYVKWNTLRTCINDILTSDDCRVNEDKLLGPFFLSKNLLEHALDDARCEDRFVKAFESKVLLYLFEDVMKMRPANIFRGHKGKMIFSELCKTFEENGVGLFGVTDMKQEEKPVRE